MKDGYLELAKMHLDQANEAEDPNDGAYWLAMAQTHALFALVSKLDDLTDLIAENVERLGPRPV